MNVPDPITQCLQQAVVQGVFPGAVLFVRVKGAIRSHQAVGRLGQAPLDQPVQVDTIYDLASLTKPLATATAVLCLIQDGRLELDQPIDALLGELHGRPIGSATIRQLLSHQAGLPAWKPYYQTLHSGEPEGMDIPARQARMLQCLAHEPLVCSPGTQALYSDFGFVLLGLAVERCSQESLSSFCERRVFSQVGAKPLFFIETTDRSRSGEAWDSALIAPTEHDPWRGRILQGEVHDENAHALGGIAGHAGLFGTAEAVGRLSRMWLDAVAGRPSLLSADLACEFVKRPPVGSQSSWGLGWDTPSRPSSSGEWFSQESFGHLGYTGTSIWVDPVHELEVILLSNRVHPTRANTGIQQLRPVLHNVVFQECV